MLQEAVATYSERVEKFAVDAWIDGAWKEITVSTNIGYKRILRFPEVTTGKLRFRLLESRLTPALSHVSAHYYTSRPPQLSFKQDVNGLVTIVPKLQDFGWNPHGQNAAGNLNVGYTIYYTTDGTEPSATSTEYKEPIQVNRGELKAVAILKGEKGAVHSERLGLAKKDWKLVGASSETKRRPATAAFDAKAETYWQSEEGALPLYLAIDLGSPQTLNGFAYTPQTRNSDGMMAKGVIKVSDDGKTWKEVERFEFGNLINDPSKRYHYFKKPVSARYVRVEATEIAAGGKAVAIAEFDLL